VVEQRLPPNLCERNFTSEEGFGLATASANAFKPPAGGAAGRRLPPARASERMSDRGSLPGPAGRVEGRPGAPLLKVAVEIAPGGWVLAGLSLHPTTIRIAASIQSLGNRFAGALLFFFLLLPRLRAREER